MLKRSVCDVSIFCLVLLIFHLCFYVSDHQHRDSSQYMHGSSREHYPSDSREHYSSTTKEHLPPEKGRYSERSSSDRSPYDRSGAHPSESNRGQYNSSSRSGQHW